MHRLGATQRKIYKKLDTSLLEQHRPSVQGTMFTVMLALLPGTAALAFVVSPAILINILISIVVALILESLVLVLRSKPVARSLSDGSIVLAAWLFALCLPPLLPLWQLVIGAAMLTLLGKHVYGGLGQNPFNPAMVGYAVLLVSFPQTMTLWFAPDALNQYTFTELLNFKLNPDALNTIISATSSTTNTTGFDAFTQATPLEQVRIRRLLQPDLLNSSAQLPVRAFDQVQMQTSPQAFEATPDGTVLTTPVSVAWPWVSSAFAIGGVFLLYKKTISWHIPTSLLLSMCVLHGLHSLLTHLPALSVAEAVFYGSAVYAAFFIATDPVTAATSQAGKLVYGTGIGCLIFFIRAFGGYPDGIAFAVLLMNLCVPLIDHLVMRATCK